jgi:hypothetical protein
VANGKNVEAPPDLVAMFTGAIAAPVRARQSASIEVPIPAHATIQPEAPPAPAEAAKSKGGRPKAKIPVVNQTVSIEVPQLEALHRIAGLETVRLRRRVLISEVLRELLDRSLIALDGDHAILREEPR